MYCNWSVLYIVLSKVCHAIWERHHQLCAGRKRVWQGWPTRHAFQNGWAPDGDAIKNTIIQTAHKQLIQEPMYALKMMSASAQCTLKSLLPTVSAVLALYESKIPTAKGIIALLKPNEKQPSHSKTMQFLKLFIRSLDKDKLHKFMRFSTGADVICVSHIDVEFVTLKFSEVTSIKRKTVQSFSYAKRCVLYQHPECIHLTHHPHEQSPPFHI